MSSSIRPPFSSSTASRFNRDGATSPAASVSSVATSGAKRKERDFETEGGGEATNINVVVRCRGRNEREIRENSVVVVAADSVKGKQVELSLGPNSLSDKTYNFDRVFSPAADQSMVFDDVVKPILDEMLAGYNCTIFAYGQTGTGKTYTMSGDMTETMGLLSDGAGIIPRVLHALFNKFDIDDRENCVKCSFIELYNEELRDLLTVEEGTKLKIYDDTSRRGHLTTMVQGMEEKHIKNATEGIQVLQDGSLKRQVAATKCNDLSSRSHTIFTITTFVRKKTEDGSEEMVSAGKLNLVDLAGSENIQRSGAENKRAAEAGLINKSLLTLGRVINALVDKSQHIPYRESKLTRLLQDSLGGRTKTCIIATISPAKSNLEETMSTLDYAFRAKNIRNKPQLNAVNKKMLLRDFAMEIERLKSELIATRQRNGVYLSNQAYEEMSAQSESRRIVLQEQAAKLETLEANLKNKTQELFALTSTFMGLKKDHESTKAQLDKAKDVLDQTELVLDATRRSLDEETHLRKRHQETEEKLTAVGGELIAALEKTVHDVDGLRAKNRRRSDLQALNRSAWATAQDTVADITMLVERRIEEFQDEQRRHISCISQRMGEFVGEELQKLTSTQAFLDRNLQRFEESKRELLDQKEKSKDEMDDVLEEIKVVRDTVKEQVGESLQAIAGAADKIAADVLSELDTFHNQLHTSYSSLGKEFKVIFEDLVHHITLQREESDRLRRQLRDATDAVAAQNADIAASVQEVVEKERKQAAEDRETLLRQMASLINAQAEAQESRLAARAAQLQKRVLDSNTSLEDGIARYGRGMDEWDEKEGQLLELVGQSRDIMKNKLRDDWQTANELSTSIQGTTRSVNAETMRVVGEQRENLHVQMEALDEFVTRARSENAAHHERHAAAMDNLSGTVEESLDSIATHFTTTFERVKDLGTEMETETEEAGRKLEPLGEQVCEPLGDLREEIMATSIKEYEPTGETPVKVQYQYPTDLPRTESHRKLLAELNGDASPRKQRAEEPDVVADDSDHADHADHPDLFPSPSALASSPLPTTTTDPAATPTTIKTRSSTTGILSDRRQSTDDVPPVPAFSMSLREVNPNLTMPLATGALLLEKPESKTASAGVPTAAVVDTTGTEEKTGPPLRRRSARHQSKMAVYKGQRGAVHVSLEGRENMPPTELSHNLGPKRKSPRLN
ncbi:hypothetical protein ACRALDRAFT_1075762 [Sodiomyces alcalophilus JCM 7366]|uniref:uncharacterized protein n=1 Tax=Sodiomyces alcalophilus JCM 7366 TaxID=591952 RepID=UPI0039B5FAF9